MFLAVNGNLRWLNIVSGVYLVQIFLLPNGQHTVKKIYVIPGLFLIKSSWDCFKYIQRLESYRKCGYISGE